jgi:pyruvate formate lyase activating enzyme
MKEEGIHTALDTAGDVTWCRFEEVLPFIDLVLYDIKLLDNDQHRRFTGRDNDLILANAQLLAHQNVPMHLRLVMVPGINDNPDEIRARMKFVKELGDSVKQVDILLYHRYGAGKYPRLGLDYPLVGLPEHTDEQVEEIRALVEGYGIKTTIGG